MRYLTNRIEKGILAMNNVSREYLVGWFTCYFSMHYATKPEHLKTHLIWVDRATKEDLLTEYKTIVNRN